VDGACTWTVTGAAFSQHREGFARLLPETGVRSNRALAYAQVRPRERNFCGNQPGSPIVVSSNGRA